MHGRMKPAEKQAVMQSFKQGELHLLVATTVIEVGVDVPNSSLMIIETRNVWGLRSYTSYVAVWAVVRWLHTALCYKAPLSKPRRCVCRYCVTATTDSSLRKRHGDPWPGRAPGTSDRER